MDLTPSELRELATFFAKRLTPELEPLDPSLPPSPGDPGAAWLARLEEAQRSEQLPQLARRISRVSPGDATLEEACRLLSAEGSGGFESLALGAVIAGGALVALGAVTVAGLFLGAAGVAGADLSSTEVALQPQSVEEEAVALQPQSVEAPQEPVAEEAAVHLADAEPVEEPVEEPVTVAVAEPVGVGSCQGFWYAGSEAPGQAGDLVVLPHAVNVRADYPDRHNAFDARAPVRCVLEQGARVRLTRDPIKVPGDKWWVPLEGRHEARTNG